ncbi:MAG: hypothetical protein ACRDHY_19785, partial [Anaerolineales bacterium]
DAVAFSSAGLMVLSGKPRTGPPPVVFRRGEVDGNLRFELNDPLAVLARLFLAGDPLPCDDAADADDDGAVSVTDAVILLRRLFLGGLALPAPGPERCGVDPTADGLTSGCLAGC